MKTFYQIVSWVFMPLMMPLLALLITFYTPTSIDFNHLSNSFYFLDPSVKQFFFNAFGLFGWVFPIASILIMKLTNQIESVELNQQHQRFVPLLLVGIYAVMLLMLLFKFNSQYAISKHFFSLAFSGVLVAVIFLIINLRFKISLHAGGVGMLLGFLFSYYLEQSLLVIWPLYIACAIGGLVISSRIGLKKHSNFELIFGFVLGFLITFTMDLVCVYYL
jgi:membrane-associated phospholipid phosphatase